MTNDYLEHYRKNAISPVRQNITDIQKHFYIRKKLYEALGLTNNDFEAKDIIEIGPGGGYNAIYTASLKPRFYQLIEANEVGVEEIKANFVEHKIGLENIDILNIFIEDLKSDKKFDVAICEGMLPCVKNNYEILNKMDTFLKPNGVMLITCSDEISIFFDMTRRLLANILIQREKAVKFKDKIALLVEAFGPHLDTLKGFGRLKEDWCADNLLGNALYNTNLSVSDVIKKFQNGYSFYDISPKIIIDPTWFKEVPQNTHEFNKKKIDAFYSVWHNLMHYKIFDGAAWSKEDTLVLRELCRDFIRLCRLSEESYGEDLAQSILNTLSSIKDIFEINSAHKMIIDSLEELYFFIQKDDITVNKVANDFEEFKSAFGRGQQYITLIKE